MVTIRCRDVSKTDLPMLLEHRNHPGTRKWLGDDRVKTSKDQEVWFEYGEVRNYQIVEDDDGPIGLLRVKMTIGDECEVGCDVFPWRRGQGFGARVFFRALLEGLARGARRFRLFVFLDNVAAVKIYERAGFVYDTRWPLEWRMREGRPCAYVKMVKE